MAHRVWVWEHKLSHVSSTENNKPGSPGWSFEAGEPRAVPADSVARRLREARNDSNQDLQDIAQFLRIRYDYLLAIEEGRFEDLPGPTYAVGFVRAYADHLKLDSDAIANAFKAEVADLSDRTELVFPTPVPESRIPGSTIVLFSVMLIAGAYGVWYYFSSDLERQVVQEPPAVETPQAETPVAVETPAPGEGQTAAVTPDSSTTDFAEATDTAGAPELPAAESHENGTVTAESEDAEAGAPTAVTAAPDEALPQAASETETTPAVEATEVTEVPEVPALPEEVPAEAAPAEAEPAPEVDPETAVAEPEPQVPAAEAEEAAAAEAEEPAILDNDAAEAAVSESAASGAEDTGLPEAVGEPIVEAAEVGVPPLPPAIPARRPSVQPESVQTAELGESSDGATVYGSENANSRVVVRAVFDSYVLIRDANDNLLLTKVLRSGDVYRVPDEAGLTMLTGNAGGLQIEVDGQQAPTIGPVGAIVRNVSLDPGRLSSGTAVNR